MATAEKGIAIDTFTRQLSAVDRSILDGSADGLAQITAPARRP
ncbi:MAG: hypothetical protein R6W95_15465 [Desulfosarcina sp.]